MEQILGVENLEKLISGELYYSGLEEARNFLEKIPFVKKKIDDGYFVEPMFLGENRISISKLINNYFEAKDLKRTLKKEWSYVELEKWTSSNNFALWVVRIIIPFMSKKD